MNSNLLFLVYHSEFHNDTIACCVDRVVECVDRFIEEFAILVLFPDVLFKLLSEIETALSHIESILFHSVNTKFN